MAGGEVGSSATGVDTPGEPAASAIQEKVLLILLPFLEKDPEHSMDRWPSASPSDSPSTSTSQVTVPLPDGLTATTRKEKLLPTAIVASQGRLTVSFPTLPSALVYSTSALDAVPPTR